MITSDRIITAAPPERVWEVLVDPVMMELWNPKCKKCHTDATAMTKGLSFEADFALGSRENRMKCTVVSCTPTERLVIRHESTDGKKRIVLETIELERTPNGTRIKQTIDMGRSGIPTWTQLVMKFLNWFGRKMGPGPLDGIKEQAESR